MGRHGAGFHRKVCSEGLSLTERQSGIFHGRTGLPSEFLFAVPVGGWCEFELPTNSNSFALIELSSAGVV